jgi:2',3'-cyclic-nucleotide 2'-phosphodiesterase (5'-nucleotidase family)
MAVALGSACNSSSTADDTGGLPDIGTSARDAGAADARSPGLDAANAPDAHVPDGAVAQADTGIFLSDAEVAQADGATTGDANVAQADVGGADSSIQLPDGATQLPDAQITTADVGLPIPDAGISGDAALPDMHLTVLQTTDVHDHADGIGWLKDKVTPGPAGSYARIAAYVNAVRTAADATHPVVLVDSGDWTMGTIYDLTLGKFPLATYFLNTMSYDCVTLGNHEFDYTPAGLAEIISVSQTAFDFQTPIVASNMNLNGNTDLAPLVGAGKAIQPTYVETLPNGLKVGYIGLMGVAAATDAPASAPVSFTNYSKDYSSVQSQVNDLRTTQGCDVVIALSHAGTNYDGNSGEDIDLARNVTGIDVIASGHTHNPFAASHPVINGSWTTQVLCAGAYGTNVFRIDLTYHPATKTTTLDASSNMAMTDTALAWIPGGVTQDPTLKALLSAVDNGINTNLGPLFTGLMHFADYVATDANTGVYHPVGSAAQDMVSNDANPVLGPNGMGDLCADAVRAVPNGIVGQVIQKLLAAGWNGSPTDPNLPSILAAANLTGYDLTPYTIGLVATGVIRDPLPAGAITFAEAYDVVPLGFTPDTSQQLPVGYPMMSVYLTLADLKTVCALQLLGQTNLTPSDDYLNLSGVSYALDAAGTYDYFKYASAATVLQIVVQKAEGGSADAMTALSGLESLGTDHGQALLTAAAAGNVYAAAMVDLNDVNPDAAHIAANLTALGTVAAAGVQGMTAVYGLIMGKAVAAIASVSQFAPMDLPCEQATTVLDGSTRYRVAADLYAVLMMGAIESYFGISITAYADATSNTVVSGANIPAAMANRINLNPGATTFQETKEWEALLLYLITPKAQGGAFTNGAIGADYASTPDFTQFPAYGNAVKVRNASYPLPDVIQLMTTLTQLVQAP